MKLTCVFCFHWCKRHFVNRNSRERVFYCPFTGKTIDTEKEACEKFFPFYIIPCEKYNQRIDVLQCLSRQKMVKDQTGIFTSFIRCKNCKTGEICEYLQNNFNFQRKKLTRIDKLKYLKIPTSLTRLPKLKLSRLPKTQTKKG